MPSARRLAVEPELVFMMGGYTDKWESKSIGEAKREGVVTVSRCTIGGRAVAVMGQS